MAATTISILIPAYNEEKAISKVVTQLRTARPHDEVLVIDDGSTDQTSELAKKAGARVIRHPKNKGYGAALKTGIRRASHDILLFYDADDQHHPADIEKILGALEEADMAVGARPKGSGALYRRSGKWFLNRVANYLVGQEIPDLNSGLRAISRGLALQFIHLLPDSFSLTTTITLALFRSNYIVVYVPITDRPRIGSSKVSLKDFFRTLLLIIRMITLFAPLKIFIPISLGLFLLALPFFTYDLFHANISDTTVILWLMGLLIFLFGLLADTISLVSRKDFRSRSEPYTK